jgi:hypothetical protein
MAEDPKPAAPAAKSRLEQLADKLWNDKGPAGAAYRAAAKAEFPDVILPEEAAEPLVAPLKAELDGMREKFDAMVAEREEEKKAAAEAAIQTNLETAVANARAKFNLTEDGFDKMVARMKETGNFTDAESAAAWVAMQTPKPAAPGPYLGPQNINLWGSNERDEAFALLHKDPTGAFLDNEFREFLKDPDQYVREAGFA